MGKLRNLTGQKFGRLTVLKRTENSKSGQTRWLCRCDCGEIVKVHRPHLISGHTKSCGCLNSEKARKRTKGNHPAWKGDDVTKEQIHRWLRSNIVKPIMCQKCQERPVRDFSYNNHKNGEWTRNPDDYEYLCRSCHMLKDIGNGAKPLTRIRLNRIRKLYSIGTASVIELADLFKISVATIYNIINHKGIYV